MFAKRLLTRLVVTSALAGGLMVVAGATPTFADRDWSKDCHDRLENAKTRLDLDIMRHGPDSREANRDRNRMENVRQWCRDHRADWNHSRFDVQLYLHR